MNYKKGAIPVIKVIAIIFTVAIFLISWVLILNISIAVNEQKINSQLAIKKIIDSNCFSNEYGTIEESKFNQDTLQSCYGKNNITTMKIIFNKTKLYTNKELFTELASKCSITSTIFCSETKYPIIYKQENINSHQIKELTIQIITK